jgi:hypothetical protein
VAGGLIHVRVVATGRSPTTLRMRAWAPGSAEPSTWSYGASDAAPALQAAGAVGLRAYLGASSTNAPVVASFDHLRAVAAAAP